MKVVHFLLHHVEGGPHQYVSNISKHVSCYEHISIVCGKKKFGSSFSLLNLRKIHYFLYPLEILANVLLIILRINRFTISGDYIFDVHGVQHIAPLISASLTRTKVVWHIHECDQSMLIFVIFGKLIIKLCNARVISVSERGSRLFKFSNAVVVPSFLQAPDVFEIEKKTTYNRQSCEAMSLLMVGNVSRVKGYDLMIEALSSLDFPVKVKVAGSLLESQKKYHDVLFDRLLTLPRHVGVEFLGRVDRQNVFELLRKCDCLLLTSRSEACPLVVLEALSAGRFVVSTDVGDVSKMLNFGSFGIIIDQPTTPKKIEQALRYIFRNLNNIRSGSPDQLSNSIDITFTKRHFISSHKKVYGSLQSFK